MGRTAQRLTIKKGALSLKASWGPTIFVRSSHAIFIVNLLTRLWQVHCRLRLYKSFF
jgi:hypothetical protein